MPTFRGRDRASQSAALSHAEEELPPIGIAVMGVTGSGKSTFINMASGSHLRVGNDLKSCTEEVAVANEFTLDGRRVFLIDTPGFDDSNVSDAQILERIAGFLAETYVEGSKLAGILYIHRISDVRFTGANTRNFRMFRKLCGDSSLKNVILVTNMWGKIEKHIGEAHERELTDVFFKAALEKGAQLARHQHTIESAHEIIRRIMKNDPAPLLIQTELVDEGKDIKATAAGEAVNEEVNALIKRHEADIKTLREDMAQALKEKDVEWEKELREETRRMTKEVNDARREMDLMAAKYDQERKRTGEMIESLRMRADEDRKQAREDRKQASEDRRQAELAKKQLEKLQSEYSEMNRAEELRKQAEEQRKRAEEERRQIEVERDRAEERMRSIEERKRVEEEKRRAEERRERAEEERREAEQEKRRAMEEYERRVAQLTAEVQNSNTHSTGERSRLQGRINHLENQVTNLGRKPKKGTCLIM